MDYNFAKELMAIGVISYSEQEKLWQIALRCAKTSGVPMAGAGAIIGVKTGSVLPGTGTVGGALTGALVGLAAGTITCTMLNVSMRQKLRELANGE